MRRLLVEFTFYREAEFTAKEMSQFKTALDNAITTSLGSAGTSPEDFSALVLLSAREDGIRVLTEDEPV
jgi:hypothetical protein